MTGRATVFIEAIGLAAPGLSSWSEARDVLAGERPWAPLTEPPYAPALLPPNERRRASPSVRQAFRAAEDARTNSALDFSRLAAVFASSDADLAISDRISRALAEPVRVVSPTDFHNSVHNAASGYWSIATGSRQPSTSVGGYDGAFAMGLLEAATLIKADRLDVLLAAFDVLAPEPLLAKRPLTCAGSVALVLRDAEPRMACARLQLALADTPESMLDDPALEALRLGNPALRALPLLCCIARRVPGRVLLPCTPGCAVQADVDFA